MTQKRSNITFFINSQRHDISGPQSFEMLAEYLRYSRSLTGTKIVCAEGDCGACTVLVASPHDLQDGNLKYRAVNACISPLYSMDACHIVTVEGLRRDDELHPVQSAMIQNFGAQCGYCTPGFITSMVAMVEDCIDRGSTRIETKRAQNCLTGNLCRCTGYKQILEAAESIPLKSVTKLCDRNPPGLKAELESISKTSVQSKNNSFTLHLPVSVQEAVTIKGQNPGIKIIAGSTDEGVFANKGKVDHRVVMSLQHVPEFHWILENGPWIEVGARVTLRKLHEFSRKRIPELARILNVFASPQIKNQATLVGNVVNGSPIADSIPFLMVSGAKIQAQSPSGTRSIPVENFYLGYKKLDLKPDELVTSIKIPAPQPGAITQLYKVSQREDLDISAVTFAAEMVLNGSLIQGIRIALGGVGPTVLRMTEIERKWKNKALDRALIDQTLKALPSLITPLSDLRGSKEFRIQLCQNLFKKFYDHASTALNSGATP